MATSNMDTFSLSRSYYILIVVFIAVCISTVSPAGVAHRIVDKRGPRVQVCQCGSLSLQKCMKVFLPACCVQHSSLGGSIACAPMGKRSMDDELFSDQGSEDEEMDIYNEFNFIKSLLASRNLLNAEKVPLLLQNESNEDRF
ncbi:uncharacterized protein LOC117122467 [Anneissia japonica]|uniref:uncharacterized protein LOC117122467 n=1 Tax=Anneissia japonica TaxID=1529436 RepID=UPI0014256E6F|nr:uncharacterized protein LOC117122467 [Anneissia japonica]